MDNDNEDCEAGPSQPRAKRAKRMCPKQISDAELLNALKESDDDIDLLEDLDSDFSYEDEEVTSSSPSPNLQSPAASSTLQSPNPPRTPQTPNASNSPQVPDAPPPPQLQLPGLAAGPPLVRTWLKDPPNAPRIPFTAVSGLKVNLNGRNPINYFNLLADDSFYELIILNSNNYAVEILAQSSAEQSRITSWKDITKEEFKIFLGLLFHMGTIRLNQINNYWKTNFLFNIPAFSTFMSRNRFLLILRAVHFNQNQETEQNKLAKITPLIDFFNSKMEQVYYPCRELSLDESMVLWRGRLSFRQYIQGKRHKYEMKLYVLAEPCGMVQKVLVYGGSADVDIGGSKHTEKVVLKLMENKTNVGHALYMDNFYNSLALSEQLFQVKTYTTGTLRANRAGNPQNVLSKKLKKGECYCEYTPHGICVCKWKDRREVLSISSEFDEEFTKVTLKRGVEQEKPKLILEYNKFMGGIDQNDQLLSYCPCEHKTLRWYKKLGIHIFQIMLINSYHIYKKYKAANKMNFYDYRLSVIENLLGPPPPKPQIQPQIFHLPEYCPKDHKGNAKRRRCKNCWDQKKIRKDVVYFCPQCPTQPGLCLTPCFREFHEQN